MPIRLRLKQSHRGPWSSREWRCYFTGTFFISSVLLLGNTQLFEAVSSVGMYLTVSRAVGLQQKPQQGDAWRVWAVERGCLLAGQCRLHRDRALRNVSFSTMINKDLSHLPNTEKSHNWEQMQTVAKLQTGRIFLPSQLCQEILK